ncbi:MAG TPA: MBL fold metallo-hydrolase, partial [Parafilimonas sp.]
YHFKQCNAVFLEANYDDAMLEASNYPYFLKRRITGDNGHLSNDAALELFCRYKSNNLTHLILSHLSKNNNSPEIVEKVFMQYCDETKIAVASRYHESEVYFIQKTPGTVKEKSQYNQHAVQLSIFN